MCFSAGVSYAATVILLPAGAVAMHRAYQRDRRYLPLARLPVLFGLQQLFEGFVWTAGHAGNQSAVETFSLAYMFFSWLAWPIWVPFSAYFIEPCRRRSVMMSATTPISPVTGRSTTQKLLPWTKAAVFVCASSMAARQRRFLSPRLVSNRVASPSMVHCVSR